MLCYTIGIRTVGSSPETAQASASAAATPTPGRWRSPGAAWRSWSRPRLAPARRCTSSFAAPQTPRPGALRRARAAARVRDRGASRACHSSALSRFPAHSHDLSTEGAPRLARRRKRVGEIRWCCQSGWRGWRSNGTWSP